MLSCFKRDHADGAVSEPLTAHTFVHQQSVLNWSPDVEKYGFQKIECNYFVPAPDQAKINKKFIRCHCGDKLDAHARMKAAKSKDEIKQAIEDIVPRELHGYVCGRDKAIPYRVEWSEKRAFISTSTDSYGKINFLDGYKKPAKYIRVGVNDNVEKVFTFMKTNWLILEQGTPQLVIYITGGAKNFKLSSKIKNQLYNALVNVADSTSAWLITSGFSVGVLKLIGEVIRDGQTFSFKNGHASHNLHHIGIGPWGNVLNKDSLVGTSRSDSEDASDDVFRAIYSKEKISPEKHQPSPLDSNVTNFILVDNGYRNRHTGPGSVTTFITAFLRHLKNQKMNVITLVINGGLGVLDDVTQSIDDCIPVVVCERTGRIADVLADVCWRSNESGTLSNQSKNRVIQNIQKIQSNWYDATTKQKYADIAIACCANENLITVYDVTKDQDLSDVFLQAIIKVENKSGDRNYFDLAFACNNAEFADTELLHPTVNYDKDYLMGKLSDAIIGDKFDFVRVILKQDIALATYLTRQRLVDLYNEAFVHGSHSHHLHYLLRKFTKKNENYTLGDIGQLLDKLIYRYDKNVYYDGEEEDCTDGVREPKCEKVTSIELTSEHMHKRTRMCSIKSLENEQDDVDARPLSGNIIDKRINRSSMDQSHMEHKTTNEGSTDCEYDDTITCDSRNNNLEAQWIEMESPDGKRERVRMNSNEEGNLFDQPDVYPPPVSNIRRKITAQSESPSLDVDYEMCEDSCVNAEYYSDLGQNPEPNQKLNDGNNTIKADRDLLIWAILNHRIELAKYLWEYSVQPISTALMSACLCKKIMATCKDAELHKSYSDTKDYFEKVGKESLEEMAEKYPRRALDLLDQKVTRWNGLTCMQIAYMANCQDFVSSRTSQIYLTNKWRNGITSRTLFVLLYTLVLPLFMLVSFDTDQKDRDYQPRRWRNSVACRVNYICTCFRRFYASPLVKFILYTFTYILFLLLFTYMVLFKVERRANFVQWAVLLWVVSYIFDELHRFIAFPFPSLRWKFRDNEGYVQCLYMLNSLMMITAFMLHLYTDNYDIVRIIYSVNIAVYYVRLLKAYTPSEYLGPKLYIISEAFKQLGLFFLIIVIFLLAYGVASYSLIYPHTEQTWTRLGEAVKHIVFIPYWHIYGELMLDEFKDDEACYMAHNHTSNNHLHPGLHCKTSSNFLPILLALYLFVGNVLLMNLIIAIFSRIFEKIEANSMKVWRFQMYNYITEYDIKSYLPPPFNLIEYLFRVMRFIHTRGGARDKPINKDTTKKLKILKWLEEETNNKYLRKLRESNDKNRRTANNNSDNDDIMDAMREIKKMLDDNDILSTNNKLCGQLDACARSHTDGIGQRDISHDIPPTDV